MFRTKLLPNIPNGPERDDLLFLLFLITVTILDSRPGPIFQTNGFLINETLKFEMYCT